MIPVIIVVGATRFNVKYLNATERVYVEKVTSITKCANYEDALGGDYFLSGKCRPIRVVYY